MTYGIMHSSRGFYIERVVRPTGKSSPHFTWKRARIDAKKFGSPGEAQRWLEAELKKPNHGLQRCAVAELK